MLAAISSIAAEASSAADACSVALAKPVRKPQTAAGCRGDVLGRGKRRCHHPRRRATIASSERPKVSLSDSGFGCTVRSPCAIFSAMPAVARRLTVMAFIASTRSLISSLVDTLTSRLRSPIATACARLTPAFNPRLMPSTIQMANPRAMATAANDTRARRAWSRCRAHWPGQRPCAGSRG